jgi:hypothetical protein
MASNIPKHGDKIIERREDQLGGVKFVASFQFQRFLDEIGSLVQQSDDSADQDIVSISVQIGRNSANINANRDQIEELFDHVASADTENAKLRALINNHIQSFSDLEQVVYGS